MTYTPNIPQSTDDPSQSQPLILSNFQQLNIQYGTSGDHIEWTASSGNGKHKKVTWTDRTGVIPTAGLNEVVAYGVTQSGVTMPYYKRDNLATQYPLSPIKAYANILTLAAAGNIVPLDSFNITSPVVQAGTTTATWTFTMTNACRTINYGVLCFFDASVNLSAISRVGYTIISTTVFSITTSAALALTTPFRMTVQVLET